MAKAMSGQNPVKPSPNGLAASVKAANSAGLPPLDQWNPPFCGDLDIRIAKDGTWTYLGSPITRFELVKLFSSILKKEDGKYYLVTPVEKVGITVDDAPFIAVDFDQAGTVEDQTLTFTTHVGDTTIAGPDFPIRIVIDPETNEPSTYVLVRANLEARLDRKTFYRLVDIGTDHGDWFGVWSGGAFFRLIPSDQMQAD
ncbi:proteophosphoglycan precursor [Ruegeria sp. ANG-S4]|nr:proteophosphoglycan precursor [Ruegeria sp. ANG-S4]